MIQAKVAGIFPGCDLSFVEPKSAIIKGVFQHCPNVPCWKSHFFSTGLDSTKERLFFKLDP